VRAADDSETAVTETEDDTPVIQENSSNTPSVTAYATKDDLMTKFTPDVETGTAENIGKLIFGMDSGTYSTDEDRLYEKADDPAPLEWYILGADSYVEGDNTIIFAADPIVYRAWFYSWNKDRWYYSSWQCVYENELVDNESKVNANHYAASALRTQTLVKVKENNFSEAEKGLMNETTVTTWDRKNSRYYTTTDTLYDLNSISSESTIILVGSKDQKRIAMDPYWNSGDYAFWLRTPDTTFGDSARIAVLGKSVGRADVEASSVSYSLPSGDYKKVNMAVRPASNLNLTSVIFASAAIAASDTAVSDIIAEGTAMTLRFDGSDRNIGAVFYSNLGDICAVKDANAENVSLVVQGKEGTNDWYYSIPVTETQNLKASDIKAALGLSGDINLSDCKIWLEITETDGFAYAVNAIAVSITEPQPITVANGTAYDAMNLPTTVDISIGDNPAATAEVAWDTTTPADGSYDPAILTGQTVTLNGTVTLPDTIGVNGVSFTTSITITILPVGTHTITASAGEGGSISPAGLVEVIEGEDQIFTVIADEDYEIAALNIDGTNINPETGYTFSNVTSDHTIEVTFQQKTISEPQSEEESPEITLQPISAAVKVGETAVFTIAATGTDPVYQWQLDRNDGNGWTDIENANEASYTIPEVDKSCDGFGYRCVVSNNAGNVESNIAALTVQEADDTETPSDSGIDNADDGNTENPSDSAINNEDNADASLYQIIDGADSSWTQESDGSVTVRGNGDFSKFTGVRVDGNLLDSRYYRAMEGSTIIILDPVYLNTLASGNHTIEILWTDGSAGTTFAIDTDTADDDDNDQSSDDSNNNDSNNNDGNSSDRNDNESNGNDSSKAASDDSALPDNSDDKAAAPQTGDQTQAARLFALAVFSATGFIFTGKRKKLITLDK
jgi:hypothetical protein